MKINKSLIFLIIFISTLTIAQNEYEKEYITVTPEPEFAAGWFYEIIYGAHWRDLWTTPIKIEILNLDKFAGGLTPLKKGGGFQTKSLRLTGKDGHIWKFRSMDKDPSKLLPEELKKTLAAEILKDQISSSNPAAPLVVAPILDSVGILQARPYLVYMPNSKKLGKFQKEFANKIGYMEIHPDVEEDEGIEFEDAEKVKSTFKLFHRLEKERDEKVNSKAYLTARLVDIFIGDWDRHADQWKWARYTKNNQKLWYPIPRDRDQAFAKFDGLLPWVSTWFLPQFNDFSFDYGHIESLTWNGRFVDRHFLTELTKTEWDSIAHFVKSKLTNSLIKNAVKKLPNEMYDLAKDELESKLLSRRDALLEMADKYYKLMNHIVDIYTSNKNDYIQIDRLDNNFTSIKYFRKDKNSGTPKGEVLYSKIFDNNLVDEFRINTLDGKDKVVLRGSVDRSPLIRIITGEGKDEIIDSSNVNGYLFSVLPIPFAERKTEIYDSGKKTIVQYGSGTTYCPDKIEKPKTDEELYRPTQRNRRNEWIFIPILDFNSDDGIILGISPTITKYDFRAAPYKYKMNLSMMYATFPSEAHLEYNSKFKNVVKNGDFFFDAILSTLVFTQYFGYGNETSYSHDLKENDYYRMKNRIISIAPSFNYDFNKYNSMNIGITYIRSDMHLNNESLLANFPRGNYGIDDYNLIGLRLIYKFDNRDNKLNPYKGIYFNAKGFYYPAWSDVEEPFQRAEADLRAYFTLNTFTRLTFAFRIGAKRSFNSFPFFGASFIGGNNSLRGYSRERFSGESAIYTQSETRFKIADTFVLMPCELGGYAFADAGRVYISAESSNKWHTGYGGGFTLSYMKRMFNLLTGFALSEERLTFTLKFKMMF